MNYSDETIKQLSEKLDSLEEASIELTKQLKENKALLEKNKKKLVYALGGLVLTSLAVGFFETISVQIFTTLEKETDVIRYATGEFDLVHSKGRAIDPFIFGCKRNTQYGAYCNQMALISRKNDIADFEGAGAGPPNNGTIDSYHQLGTFSPMDIAPLQLDYVNAMAGSEHGKNITILNSDPKMIECLYMSASWKSRLYIGSYDDLISYSNQAILSPLKGRVKIALVGEGSGHNYFASRVIEETLNQDGIEAQYYENQFKVQEAVEKGNADIAFFVSNPGRAAGKFREPLSNIYNGKTNLLGVSKQLYKDHIKDLPEKYKLLDITVGELKMTSTSFVPALISKVKSDIHLNNMLCTQTVMAGVDTSKISENDPFYSVYTQFTKMAKAKFTEQMFAPTDVSFTVIDEPAQP